MSLVRQYWIGGRYIGAGPAERERIHEGLYVPRSYAYFCPSCGDVWARVIVLDGEVSQKFFAWVAPCPKHELDGVGVSGSLLLPLNHTFNVSLPDEMIQWEFEQHLRWAEKKYLRK